MRTVVALGNKDCIASLELIDLLSEGTMKYIVR